jgi:hypothetical protein
MSQLTNILEQLIDARDRLFTLINDSTKPNDVRIAALGEHDEVAMRIRTLLARDLTQRIENLEEKAAKIKEAHSELREVLAKAAHAADVVKSVTKYLGFVDKAIDAVKPFLAFL